MCVKKGGQARQARQSRSVVGRGVWPRVICLCLCVCLWLSRLVLARLAFEWPLFARHLSVSACVSASASFSSEG